MSEDTELQEKVELKVGAEEAPAELPAVVDAAEPPVMAENASEPTKKTKQSLISLVLGVWLMASALQCAASSSFSAYAEWSLQDHPKLSEAKVVKKQGTRITYSYQDDKGKAHGAWKRTLHPDGVNIGDTRQVKYSPEDPNHWAFTPRDIEVAQSVSSAVLSLIAFLIGLIYTISPRLADKLTQRQKQPRVEKENPNESGYRKWKRAQQAKQPKRTSKLTPQVLATLCAGAVALGLGLNTGSGVADKFWKQHELDTHGVVVAATLTAKYYDYADDGRQYPCFKYGYVDEKKGDWWRTHWAEDENDYKNRAVGTDTRQIKYLPEDPMTVQWVGEESLYQPSRSSLLFSFVMSLSGITLLGASFLTLCGAKRKPNQAVRRTLLVLERSGASFFFALAGVGVIYDLVSTFLSRSFDLTGLLGGDIAILLLLTMAALSWWRAAGRRYKAALEEIAAPQT